MDPVFYKIVRPFIKTFVKITFRPKMIGLDNIPKEGRVILAGNHTSNFDCILIISSTKRCVHFLAKDSLYKGMKKILFKNMGIIPVNRQIHDKQALNSAIDTLNKDRVIGIFPEGTINRTNDIIMPFKYGAVKMASETDSLIVPFTITGKYKPFKNDLIIKFEPAYKLNSDDLTKENEKLMKIVENNLKTRREK